MDEFQGKSKQELEILMVGLVTYKQGCIDFFARFVDSYEKMIEMCNEKISKCQDAINNHET